jgi:predicted nicotinamide N-methyase
MELQNEGDSDCSIQLSNGSTIYLYSKPQSLTTTTGWVTWNASLAVIRYLEMHPEELLGRIVGDLSTGNGLVALAAAYLGASSVVATEVSKCSPLTNMNVTMNPSVQHQIQIHDYDWGSNVCPIQDCDLVIGSDLLFIAIRDNIYSELRATLILLCHTNRRVLFAYEERILDKELSFLKHLEHDLKVTEILDEAFHGRNESYDIFYEPPRTRLFLMCCKGSEVQSRINEGNDL